MAKITSKLQLTLPKTLAKRFGVKPGDEVEWIAADDTIRLVLARDKATEPSIAERLELFDQATHRQHEREHGEPTAPTPPDRGWSREELYDRGRAD